MCWNAVIFFFPWKPLLKLNLLSPMVCEPRGWEAAHDDVRLGPGEVCPEKWADKWSGFLKGCWWFQQVSKRIFIFSKTMLFLLGHNFSADGIFLFLFFIFSVQKWACFFSLKQKFVKYQFTLATRNSFLFCGLCWGWGRMGEEIYFFFLLRGDLTCFCAQFQWHTIRCLSLLCSSLFLMHNTIAFITWYWHYCWFFKK